MDRIGFILGNVFLYWNSIILVLAAGVAACLFLAFFRKEGGTAIAAAVAVPMMAVLSLFFGRLIHWYFRPDSYSGFIAAMTDDTSGGYALLGAFLGWGLTAAVLWAVGLEKRILVTLDAMSLSGCGGIALGRLACFFNGADRGQLLEGFPLWSYPVYNAVTGAEEYRLATFLLQAMASAVIFGVLTAYFLLAHPKRGDVTVVFLLLYGMSQAVLDSTRYDSLTLRSNGFVSVVQLLSAAAMVGAGVLLWVRQVKNGGFRGWYVAVWLGMSLLMGAAGYMEYYVQRHGDRALLSYSVMALCLGAVAALALLALDNRKTT